MSNTIKTAVILLNWNGEEDSLSCIDALKKQTMLHDLIVVDNNSSDNLVSTVKEKFKDIVVLENPKNYGFAGGVNTGIRYAMHNDYEYAVLINNDAQPNDNWLSELVDIADKGQDIGIVTGKLLKPDNTIDSTGDLFTSWGLPYPRGRNTEDAGQYDTKEEVFAGSGGASLYRIKALKEIALFDEDFFAYYEDVDLAFRAQLAGWRVVYNPKAVAHHKIGASSGKVPGLTTYMTIKNLPWLFWKNVPVKLMPTILPRFTIAYTSIVFSSLAKGKFIPVFKGLVVTTVLLPKKLYERYKIQSSRKVSADYIKSIITYDLPPNADKLKKVRAFLKKLRFWK